MQLEFEDWLERQELSADTYSLFSEALICYKAGAYRAALLFSYLGFQTVLKNRILAAQCPNGYDQPHWDDIQDRVKDDDTWDSEVFDATQRKNPAPIFPISEDLRDQVKFWKNRRNDCAHFKRNEISHSHVESFWLFVRSNLSRFSVVGSKQHLLDRIRDHYDPSITPPGESPAPIVEEIPHAVDEENLTDFLHDVAEVFDELEDDFPSFHRSDGLDLIDGVLQLGLATVDEAVGDFLQERDELLVDFLRAFPRHVNLLSGRPGQVRRLWYELLFRDQRGDLPILCALLRNNLVPEDQYPELSEQVVDRIGDEIPSDDCAKLLEEVRLFEELHRRTFTKGEIDQFDWGNSKSELIVWYVDRHGHNEEIVSTICDTFDGRYYPYDLGEAFDEYYGENDEAREEFCEIAEEAEGVWSLPSGIPSLKEREDEYDLLPF